MCIVLPLFNCFISLLEFPEETCGQKQLPEGILQLGFQGFKVLNDLLLAFCSCLIVGREREREREIFGLWVFSKGSLDDFLQAFLPGLLRLEMLSGLLLPTAEAEAEAEEGAGKENSRSQDSA
jgi:hypothetical protein